MQIHVRNRLVGSPTMLAVVLGCLCVNFAVASPADAVSEDQLFDIIEVLASDEFEGRMPGTAGGDKTENYLASLWRAFGVQPANDGSFFQQVDLAGIQQVSASDAVFSNGTDKLVLENRVDIVFSGGQVAEVGRLDASDVVFVGYGISAPEYDWDDYAGIDVRGKTVIALWGDPGIHNKPGDERRFKGRAATIHAMSTFKAEQAAKHGAAGILLVHEEALAGWPWAVAIQGLPSIKYKIMDDVDTNKSPIIGGLLSIDAAKRLFAYAGKDLEALSIAAREKGFQGVALGLAVDMSVANELSEVTSSNVVGIVPGSKRPDEYVVYTAHWDHVGVKPELEGDNIFNGAMDNATGTAGISEIARIIASMETAPDRSVVFIATTAEEQGLLGAFYYTSNPLFPLASTAGVFNMDAHYPYGETNGMIVVGLGNSELEQYIVDAAVAIGRETYANPAPEQGAFYRSDHYPFAKAGVPSIYAVGAPLPREGDTPTRQEELMAEYGMTKYHKPGDEIEPDTWDLAGIVQDVSVYLQAGLALANSPSWPNWYRDNEFRATRDAMRP